MKNELQLLKIKGQIAKARRSVAAVAPFDLDNWSLALTFLDRAEQALAFVEFEDAVSKSDLASALLRSHSYLDKSLATLGQARMS